MFVAEYLKNLLKKAGVNAEDEKFKVFFENPELGKLDVPAEIVSGTDANLISLAVAKDNFGPLKNHYTALALNGIDTYLDTLTDEFGLTEDDKNEFKIEKNTNKKVGLLAKKIQAAETKKANADKPDKAAIQKTIDDLNKAIVTERQKGEAAIENSKKEIKQMRLQYALSALFGNHKTIYDETLSPDVKNMTIENVIKSGLQKKGAKIDFDESGNMVVLRNDGTNYFGEDHQPVTPAKFIETELSTNKLLAVNKPAPPAPPANPGSQNRINGNPNSGTSSDKIPVGQNPLFQELMQNATKDFKNINGVLQP